MTTDPVAPVSPRVLTVASPLPALFAEQKNADYQAREALFTTFNADLGFFERTVLGTVQATGARITVVADARVWSPDPRATRNAGTRYLPALAVHTGAFHPKVNVIVGPSRALVTVGSGNLSPGGWHLNDEIWTLAYADRDGCPSFAAQVASWLRDLPDVVVVDDETAAALQRTARELENLVSSVPVIDTGHRLVHTLNGALIDQLPAGPVHALDVYAPFHDSDCAALAALITRFTPDAVRVTVQGHAQTSIDPAALAKVVASARSNGTSVEVLEAPSTRYRHGKLIEATRADGTRWALTGSPNLSRAALLKSARRGGNIEVGLVVTGAPVLYPGGDPIDATAVVARIAEPSSPSALDDEPVLLSAVRGDNGHVRVLLAHPARTPCTVQVSAHFAFDTWIDACRVPLGQTTVSLDGVHAGGTRVRAAWTGADGLPRAGTTRFVVDPTRVMQRAADTTSLTRSHVQDPFLIITDPRLADLWLSGLAQLAAAQSQIALPAVSGAGAPQGEPDSNPHPGKFLPDDEHSWLTYQDDATARMGPAMFAFALGGMAAVSALTRTTEALTLQQPTDKLVDESAAGFDADDADTVNDETDPVDDTTTGGADGTVAGTATIDSSGSALDEKMQIARAAQQKARIRARLTRAVREQAPNHAAVDRSAVVLLTLVAVHAQVWPAPHGPKGWVPVIADALEVLEHRTIEGVSDIPERLATNIGSLAAVGLYMLHDVMLEHDDATEAGRYRRTSGAIAHLLESASASCIAEYVAPMRNNHGFPVDPDAVLSVALTALDDAPLAGVIDQIQTNDADRSAHAHSAHEIHVTDPSARNAMLVAAEALTLLTTDKHAPWAAMGTNGSGHSCLLVRHDQDLLAVERLPTGAHRVEQFRLPDLVTPVRVARDPDTRSRVRVKRNMAPAGMPTISEMLAMADRSEVDEAVQCRKHGPAT